jgi:hypothetical protein
MSLLRGIVTISLFPSPVSRFFPRRHAVTVVSCPGNTRHQSAGLFDATHNALVLRAKYIDPSPSLRLRVRMTARTYDANLRDSALG